MYNPDGCINDLNDVKLGITYVSEFAYLADGRNGLRVVQLTSPERQPNFYGFSPDPNPEVIAWWPTRWPALALSKGLDRDRAVDETGHQIAVFGRLGSRPMTLAEQQMLYMKNGVVWAVTDEVKMDDFRRGEPKRRLEFKRPEQAKR